MGNISSSSLLNDQEALKHVKSLAFSRKAGTVGEYISRDYIISRLKEENIKTEVEPFLWVSIWVVYKFFFISLILLLLFEVLFSFFKNTDFINQSNIRANHINIYNIRSIKVINFI